MPYHAASILNLSFLGGRGRWQKPCECANAKRGREEGSPTICRRMNPAGVRNQLEQEAEGRFFFCLFPSGGAPKSLRVSDDWLWLSRPPCDDTGQRGSRGHLQGEWETQSNCSGSVPVCQITGGVSGCPCTTDKWKYVRYKYLLKLIPISAITSCPLCLSGIVLYLRIPSNVLYLWVVCKLVQVINTVQNPTTGGKARVGYRWSFGCCETVQVGLANSWSDLDTWFLSPSPLFLAGRFAFPQIDGTGK